MNDRRIPREVREELRKLGFVLARAKRHYIYKHPSGASVSVSASPSNKRAYGNLISDARRMLRERGLGGK